MAYRSQVLPSSAGGTGVANSNTITIGGAISTANSFTTSGNFPLTLTQTGSTNVTLPTSGTLATTAQLPSITATQYDVLVGGAANAVESVGPGSAGQILQSGGNAANPAYSTATYPSTAGTSGKILISDGTNIISSTPTYPNSASSTGTILRADGTNWVATTNTYPNTTPVSNILYASSANVIGNLATANNAVLATDGSGVPSITTAPRVTSITFDGTNLLANYATATFSPTVQSSNSNMTGISYAAQVGRYTRIGNIVNVFMLVVFTNTGAGTGSLIINNLPFTVKNETSYNPIGACALQNIAFGVAGSYILASAQTNTTNVVFATSASAVASANIATAAFTNAVIQVSIVYEI